MPSPVVASPSCLFITFFLFFASHSILSRFLSRPLCPGSSVSGHDESPGDHAATDAADPPAAGAFPPAAPGPAPTAAGCYATAGTNIHSRT